MRQTLLAVFGHYDSRGGTIAIPMSEKSEAEAREAMRRYDRDAFGIEEDGDSIQTTAYGMPAREADKAVHSILYGNERPSEQDFMFVAVLHHPDDACVEGDLEEYGAVLIDETTVPAVFESAERVPAAELIRATLDAPVQLEYVPYPKEAQEARARINDTATSREEYQRLWAEFYRLLGEEEDGCWAEDTAPKLVKVIEHPSYRDWNDDAFGFVVL